ncbi:MAG: cytochrome c biogenesis protein CcsA [Rubrobacteridae bacterium]|nr:cytochrome c biogenesis protein CcsA [Rubrobacteridae bacterium]
MFEKVTIVLFWLSIILSVVSSLAYIGHVAARVDRKVHTWTGVATAIGAFVLLLVVLFARVYRLTEPLTKQLQHYWVGMHVTFAVLGYASMTIALGLAIVYLLQERELKNMGKKKPGKLFRKLPSLETADDLCHTVIAFSFTFLSLVLATGVMRAEMLTEWSLWYQDPKILMAAATWVVYGSYLFVRSTLGWRGKRANMFAIFGFVVAIVAYSIGNVEVISRFLPSVHSYGKGLG